jgi:hypothetical protein
MVKSIIVWINIDKIYAEKQKSINVQDKNIK